MKRYYRISIIILFLMLSCISLFYYFSFKKIYVYYAVEIVLSRILTIIFFNLLFFSIIFLLNFEYYKRVFKYVLLFIIFSWIIIYVIAIIPSSRLLWDIWEIMTFFSFSMIPPGLIMYIIYYIKKITTKYEVATILGKYHIHEGLVGVLFLVIGFFLLILRSSLLFLSDPLYRRLSYILISVQVLSFIFLYLGSFFFFRDRHDIIHLKFIEIKTKYNKNRLNEQFPVFKNLIKEDLHFFKVPKLLIYPFGIILTIFSISLVIYGIDVIPTQIINLHKEYIIQLGYVFCFISGGMVGIDWLRLFKRFYPEVYKKLQMNIDKLKNQEFK